MYCILLVDFFQMFGILFAYLILIYQTRDNKQDMADLVKAKSFNNRLDQLSFQIAQLAALVSNSTKNII